MPDNHIAIKRMSGTECLTYFFNMLAQESMGR